MARILVVDDDPYGREFITRALGARGHQVASATDGAKALGLAQGDPPDLMVAELRLRRPDGVEIFHAIRRLCGGIPVILTTGDVLPADALPALQSDRVWYLPKPVRLERLNACVADALGTERAPLAMGEDPETSADHDIRIGAGEDAARLRGLVAVLGRVARVRLERSAAALTAHQLRAGLVRRLADALAHECASVQAVLICGWGLRTIVDTPDEMPGELADRIGRRLRAFLTSRQRLDDRAAAAIASLLVAGRDCGRLRELDLAVQLGTDPAHLGHLIRRQTGFGFVQWSWGVRIRAALPLLADAPLPVKTIAYESGFAAPAHFDRCFRRTVGLRPLTFRRLARPNPE